MEFGTMKIETTRNNKKSYNSNANYLDSDKNLNDDIYI